MKKLWVEMSQINNVFVDKRIVGFFFNEGSHAVRCLGTSHHHQDVQYTSTSDHAYNSCHRHGKISDLTRMALGRHVASSCRCARNRNRREGCAQTSPRLVLRNRAHESKIQLICMSWGARTRKMPTGSPSPHKSINGCHAVNGSNLHLEPLRSPHHTYLVKCNHTSVLGPLLIDNTSHLLPCLKTGPLPHHSMTHRCKLNAGVSMHFVGRVASGVPRVP